jgi:hypothetical protein
MDNVQNCDSYINVPSSQTYISYLMNDIWSPLVTRGCSIDYSVKQKSNNARGLKEGVWHYATPLLDLLTEL